MKEARHSAAARFHREGTKAERLAVFAHRVTWRDLSRPAREALKIRVLDALGCAYGALGGEPVRMLREHVDEFGGRPMCTLIGGGRSAPDRAALYNGALVRYLDFNDSYLAKGETCHPSDNLAAVLAAAEYAGASGKEFLTALAVAYQVQCRLSDEAPLRARGFDHVTHGAVAAAAATGRLLSLDIPTLANAVAIAAAANGALRVTRTGELSHWKGLAASYAACNGLRAAFFARRGITGPGLVFEGPRGWTEALSGPFDVDWETEDLEKVRRTILKRYNSEIHSQSAVEGVIGLITEGCVDARDIVRIRVEIFDVAHLIIGGGAEGDKTNVRTKEAADHSLPYIVAVAALDGQLGPAQYLPERILRRDVQALLRRVEVVPVPDLSARFPDEHACRLTVRLRDGRVLTRQMSDYEGFHTRPMSWERAVDKFLGIAGPARSQGRLEKVIEAVAALENLTAREFAGRMS